jgi:hypothetical protein
MKRVRGGSSAAAKDVQCATTRDHCPVVLELDL